MDINLIIQQAVEEVLKQVGAAGCAAGADNGDLSPASMAKYLDDTLLKADATIEQIKAVCDEAKQYHCASVCVNTGYIAYVAEQLSGSGVTPCCVIGFPLGAMTSEAKAAETRDAIQKGAREVDMVINVGAIKSRNWDLVLSDIKAVVDAARGYAKTKAEATQAVLDDVKAGLRAVVVQPSGILGPYDASGNHLVQMVSDYIRGRLPACVQGGYDFVDVRDVAQGCLLAAEKGRIGECYILSNRHYEVREVLAMARAVCGGRRLPVLPMWMARAAAPMLEWVAKRRRERPLYTKYSLYTLASNDRFSHDKATLELGYRPRDLYQTVADTVAWLKQQAAAAVPRPQGV